MYAEEGNEAKAAGVGESRQEILEQEQRAGGGVGRIERDKLDSTHY